MYLREFVASGASPLAKRRINSHIMNMTGWLARDGVTVVFV
jgi:RecA/RadA recombinase